MHYNFHQGQGDQNSVQYEVAIFHPGFLRSQFLTTLEIALRQIHQ